MPMARDTTATPSFLPGQAREGAEWLRAWNTTAPFPSATNSFLSWIQGPVIQEEQTSELHD